MVSSASTPADAPKGSMNPQLVVLPASGFRKTGIMFRSARQTGLSCTVVGLCIRVWELRKAALNSQGTLPWAVLGRRS